ncbi:MAG TPA: erythromycin esterase family protein [Candidatus Saccharimonadia bacterium]|nr:erythromycin esterase family protein [Candidatus Saccharimonadia bacterium]
MVSVPRSNPSPLELDAVRAALVPLSGPDGPWDELLHRIGDARFVLLGEATHGTHEFYRARIEITKRLIVERGFAAVAIEADWPDAFRVDRYVRGESDDRNAGEALSGFERFPAWMWRNTDVLAFVEWLRAHNDTLARAARVGFHGLDLYSLHRSMAAVLQYLDAEDPEAARRARERYGCFDHFGEDPQAYGHAAAFELTPPCEAAVLAQLRELLRLRSTDETPRELFDAQQNAQVVRNAERYYRSMFAGRASSWNVRDRHMMEVLLRIVAHLERDGARAKLAVWAHNSHLGDARHTSMADQGELNLGQLVRQQYADESFLLGFTTSTGTVTAADNWDEPPQRKAVQPPLPGSYERLFHELGEPAFLLPFGRGEPLEALAGPLLERSIGVIYRPGSERISHYLEARIDRQFDAVVHFDTSRALAPLDASGGRADEDPPDTYPSGL